MATHSASLQGMSVNFCCPSLPVHEASLPHPLVLAIGVGHIKVVEVLLQHEDIELEIK